METTAFNTAGCLLPWRVWSLTVIAHNLKFRFFVWTSVIQEGLILCASLKQQAEKKNASLRRMEMHQEVCSVMSVTDCYLHVL